MHEEAKRLAIQRFGMQEIMLHEQLDTSSNYLEIIDGTFTISSGDYAIHAETQIIGEALRG